MLPSRFGLLFLGVTATAAPTPSAAAEPAPHEQPSSWRTSIMREPRRQPGPPVPSIVTSALTHPHHEPRHELSGLASFYWQEQQTASGEPFDKSAMTAAHRTLPFGTRVRVTYVRNGRSVIVRINDRGPFRPGRVIDLSKAAAEALEMTAHGLARVRLDVLE